MDIGIAAIGVHEPPVRLPNSWFVERGLLENEKRYVRKRGIEERGFSLVDERAMVLAALEDMQKQIRADLPRCIGLVLTSTSLIPADGEWKEEHRRVLGGVEEMAQALEGDLGLPAGSARGINWGCTGYVRAVEIAKGIAEECGMSGEEFILVATASRPGKHTDFGDKETGTILGDGASVSLLAPMEGSVYPVRLRLRHVFTGKLPTEKPLFTNVWREDVLMPAFDAGSGTLGDARDPRRLCWQMDGDGVGGVGERAPEIMLEAAMRTLHEAGIDGGDVGTLVPHQAGKTILDRLADRAAKEGIAEETVTDGIRRAGNLTCTSIPHALRFHRERLRKTVLCPATGLYVADTPLLSVGCLALEARR